jgi:hypothetical protein
MINFEVASDFEFLENSGRINSNWSLVIGPSLAVKLSGIPVAYA